MNDRSSAVKECDIKTKAEVRMINAGVLNRVPRSSMFLPTLVELDIKELNWKASAT